MGDGIEIDLGKGFPYHEDTFDRIRHLSELILRVSKRVDVPPVAVAGSIADEFNALRTENWTLRRCLDWIIDETIPGLRESVFDWSVRHGHHSKFLNATRHDIGAANINLATARAVYDEFHERYLEDTDVRWGYLVQEEIPSWEELVDYVLTGEGTVVITALVIRKAMEELSPFLVGRSAEIREAVLVTVFKQGPSYLSRFKVRLALNQGAMLRPGEGCRVYHQRAEILRALGLTLSDVNSTPAVAECR
ncbi:MAG TPA: hypothetical protein VFX59_10175 [Polyangiales bacterium]|nr:hypothetical protein [Polyangiales bacterium]